MKWLYDRWRRSLRQEGFRARCGYDFTHCGAVIKTRNPEVGRAKTSGERIKRSCCWDEYVEETIIKHGDPEMETLNKGSRNPAYRLQHESSSPYNRFPIPPADIKVTGSVHHFRRSEFSVCIARRKHVREVGCFEFTAAAPEVLFGEIKGEGEVFVYGGKVVKYIF